MSLSIYVEAEPASLWALADYFEQMAGRADQARIGAMNARSDSAPWQGEAGEGFRATAYQLNQDGTALMQAYETAAEQVRGHAHDIDAVLRRIGDARDVAVRAGLTVTDHEIQDPGPPPPQPRPFLTSDTNADQQAKRAELDASVDWTQKAAAYAQCTAMVAEARTVEQDSQSRVMDVIDTIAPRPIVTVSNFLTGLAAGVLSQQETWRTTAADFKSIATDASAAAKNTTYGAATQSKNLLLAMVSQARAGVTEARADTSTMGAWAEKLPTWAQFGLKLKIGDIAKDRPFLSKAPSVFRNVSGLGLGFAAFNIAADAAEGKDVGKSATTTGSGLLAGTEAGALIGGPWGAVAGFIVGTGTSIGVGELWDHAKGKEFVIAPGYPGYTGTLQAPGDPGPM